MYGYPVNLKNDDGAIIVAFPDFPECRTFGDDRAAALEHAADALDVALYGRMVMKQDIPAPSPARGRPLVRPPLQSFLKALVYQAMRDGKVRKIDLMRRLDWKPAQIERLLNPRHASRLSQYDAALDALGIELDIRARAKRGRKATPAARKPAKQTRRSRQAVAAE